MSISPQSVSRIIYATHHDLLQGTHYLLNPWSRVLLEKLTGSEAGQEIPLNLWNRKVHYRIQKCPPPIPILSRPHPVSTSSQLLKFHLHINFPSNSRSPQGPLTTGFLTRNLCKTFPTLISATCPTHLIHLDFYHPHNIRELVKISKFFLM